MFENFKSPENESRNFERNKHPDAFFEVLAPSLKRLRNFFIAGAIMYASAAIMYKAREHNEEKKSLNREEIEDIEYFKKEFPEILDSTRSELRELVQEKSEYLRALENAEKDSGLAAIAALYLFGGVESRESYRESLQRELQSIKDNIDDDNFVLQKAQDKFRQAFFAYSAQKEWFMTHVDSPGYKRRLIEGEQLSRDDLEKRKALLQENDFHISPYETLLENVNHGGQYDHVLNKIRMGTSPQNIKDGHMIHELQHNATRNKFGMSKHAKELYAHSLNVEEIVTLYGTESDERVDYLSNPTEMDARKKVLEWDMEQLGIKKYEDNFTDEHIDQLFDSLVWSQLSVNAKEFLLFTKREYLKEIMNTIAYDESYQDGDADTA
jgi:hypothetical protein